MDPGRYALVWRIRDAERRPDMGTHVCVIGLWHLGCVYSACFAKLGYEATGTDENKTIIENLRRGRAPVFEPGLNDLIAEGMASGRLNFTDDIEEGLRNAEYVIIAYDTPVDTEDKMDLSPVLRAATRLKSSTRHATVVVSSQVPVGTCEQVASIFASSGMDLSLAYVPENLRLGKAIECFMSPDMIVIGAKDPSAMVKARALFAPIRTRIIEMDLRSAEMTKHALNAFLATSISFANEIGNICDLIGADGMKVAEALKSDSRIGAGALLRPGLGFSGGTLARDLMALREMAERLGYQPLLMDGVLSVNQRQNASIVPKLAQLVGKLKGKSVGVLGLTYKAGTSTLRRSAALEIARLLEHAGASVKAFDPHVSKRDVSCEPLSLCDDPYGVCRNADVLLILNDWPGFTELDFERIRSMMNEPVVLDAQNLLDPGRMVEYGFTYMGVGRGAKRAPLDS
jgi:UDPglucose 6-dehydrogenase